MKAFASTALAVLLLSGCMSGPTAEKGDLVHVVAVVKRCGPDTQHICGSDGTSFEAHLFSVDLEVKVPTPKYESILPLWVRSPLPEGHVLKRVGATVEFSVPREYLVEILTDPRKPHDLPFLYLDSIVALTEVRGAPNKSPEPTPGSVTPAASAPGAPPPSAAQL